MGMVSLGSLLWKTQLSPDVLLNSFRITTSIRLGILTIYCYTIFIDFQVVLLLAPCCFYFKYSGAVILDYTFILDRQLLPGLRSQAQCVFPDHYGQR